MSGIFITFRPNDSEEIAYQIYRELRDTFADIYIDIEREYAGHDLHQAIDQAITASDALMVVIGPNWLKMLQANDQKQAEDWVRYAINRALQHDIPIVPMLVDGANLPRESDLPPDLTPLSHLPAVQIHISRYNLVPRVSQAVQQIRLKQQEKAETQLAVEQAQRAEAVRHAQQQTARRNQLYRFGGLAAAVVIAVVFLLTQQPSSDEAAVVTPTPISAAVIVTTSAPAATRTTAPTATTTLTPTTDPTATPSATPTPTLTATSTATPTLTVTRTATLTHTPTAIPTSTATWTPTLSPEEIQATALAPTPRTSLAAQSAAMMTRAAMLRGFPAAITGLAISPDGNWMAVGTNAAGSSGGVWLWDIAAQSQGDMSVRRASWESPFIAVTSLAFAPNSGRLAAGTFDGRIALLNPQLPAQPQGVLDTITGRSIDSLAFSPDGVLVAGNAAGFLFAWDSNNRPIPFDPSCQLADGGVTQIAFQPGGSNFVAGYIKGALLRVEWDATESAFICPSEGEKRATTINALAYSADGLLAWGSDNDDLVYLWDGNSSPVLIPATDPTALTFSPDGTLLAVGHTVAQSGRVLRGVVSVYDVSSPLNPLPLRVFAESAHNNHIRGLAFTPDGGLLISGGNNDVRLWGIP